MAGTLSFGPATLAPGTFNEPATGGFALADSDVEAVLTVDRTVTSGLNAVTSAVNIILSIWQSNDSGATWVELESDLLTGGTITIPAKYGGGTQIKDVLGITLAPGTGRLARAQVTVSGGSVAVAGTLVIT